MEKDKVNTTQHLEVEEPKSAHATPVVEKYVKKRKEKAETQVDKEAEQRES